MLGLGRVGLARVFFTALPKNNSVPFLALISTLLLFRSFLRLACCHPPFSSSSITFTQTPSLHWKASTDVVPRGRSSAKTTATTKTTAMTETRAASF